MEEVINEHMEDLKQSMINQAKSEARNEVLIDLCLKNIEMKLKVYAKGLEISLVEEGEYLELLRRIILSFEENKIKLKGEMKDFSVCARIREMGDEGYKDVTVKISEFEYELEGDKQLKSNLNFLVKLLRLKSEGYFLMEPVEKLKLKRIENGVSQKYEIERNEYYSNLERLLKLYGHFNEYFTEGFCNDLSMAIREKIDRDYMMLDGEISLNLSFEYRMSIGDGIKTFTTNNSLKKVNFTFEGILDYVRTIIRGASFLNYDVYEYNWILYTIISIVVEMRCSTREFIDKPVLKVLESEKMAGIEIDGEDKYVDPFIYYDSIMNGEKKIAKKKSFKVGEKRSLWSSFELKYRNWRDFLVDPSFMGPRNINLALGLYNKLTGSSLSLSYKNKAPAGSINYMDIPNLLHDLHSPSKQCFIDAVACFTYFSFFEENLIAETIKDTDTLSEIKEKKKDIYFKKKNLIDTMTWSDEIFREIHNHFQMKVYENSLGPITLEKMIDLQPVMKVYFNLFKLVRRDKNMRRIRYNKKTRQKIEFESFLQIIPVYCSPYKEEIGEKMNLLIIENHLYLITKFSRLFKVINDGYRCEYCFLEFRSYMGFRKHKINCRFLFKENIFLKKSKKEFIEFEKHTAKTKFPFVIYADFESLMKKEIVDGEERVRHVPCAFSLFTDSPYKSFKEDKDLMNFILELDRDGTKDMGSRFLQAILFESRRIAHGLGFSYKNNSGKYVSTKNRKFNKNLEEIKKAGKETKCYLCGEKERKYLPRKKAKEDEIDSTKKKKQKKKAKILDLSDAKYDCFVSDHCHVTGDFRGLAHSGCNLQAKLEKKIFVVMHNGMGYDIHLFLEKLFKGKVNILAKSFEKYLSLTVNEESYIDENNKYNLISSDTDLTGKDYFGRFIESESNKYYKENNATEHRIKTFEIVFIDSLNFLRESLEVLILKTAGSSSIGKYKEIAGMSFFPSNLKKVFEKFTGENDLFTRKGLFCYDYLDDYKKLNNTEFPAYENFYSALKGNVEEKDYKEALKIYTEGNIKNLGDYLKLYLTIDVIGLAMVFNTFRDNCLSEYRLDPVNFISMAALTWNAFLLYSGVSLENIKDERIFLMVERNIRGGVVKAGPKLHGKADNQTTFIKYFDANSLYASVMCLPLPYRNFELVEFPADRDLDAEIKLIMDTEWVKEKQHTLKNYEKEQIKRENISEAKKMLSSFYDDLRHCIASSEVEQFKAELENQADIMFARAKTRSRLEILNSLRSKKIDELKQKNLGKKTEELLQMLNEEDRVYFKNRFKEIEKEVQGNLIRALEERKRDLNEIYGMEDTSARFYCVDMEIPQEKFDDFYHDTFELPLAPFRGEERLELIVGNRYNYLVHAELLKFYVKMGYVIKKIHCYISFTQNPFLRGYIQRNINRRKETTDPGKKDLHKLANNSVFGKTLQNPRKYKKYKFFVTYKENKELNISHKDFLSIKRSKEVGDYTLCEMIKTDLIIDKPIYIGFSILELSKLTMYSHHYGIKKSNLRGEAKLMYMDTDSLIYFYKLPEIQKDSKRISSMLDDLALSCPQSFDGSVFLVKDPTFIKNLENNLGEEEAKKFLKEAEKNVGKIGLLKDVLGENKITEFVALRAKCYAYKCENDKTVAANKGVPKSAMASLNFEKYMNCYKLKKILGEQQEMMDPDAFKEAEQIILEEQKNDKVTFYAIKKHKGIISTFRDSKTGLCSFDGKTMYSGQTFIGDNILVENAKGKMVARKEIFNFFEKSNKKERKWAMVSREFESILAKAKKNREQRRQLRIQRRKIPVQEEFQLPVASETESEIEPGNRRLQKVADKIKEKLSKKNSNNLAPQNQSEYLDEEVIARMFNNNFEPEIRSEFIKEKLAEISENNRNGYFDQDEVVSFHQSAKEVNAMEADKQKDLELWDLDYMAVEDSVIEIKKNKVSIEEPITPDRVEPQVVRVENASSNELDNLIKVELDRKINVFAKSLPLPDLGKKIASLDFTWENYKQTTKTVVEIMEDMQKADQSVFMIWVPIYLEIKTVLFNHFKVDPSEIEKDF